MYRKIFAILSLLLVQILIAQNTRKVGDFTSLKVYDKINVELIPSDKVRVESSNPDVETVNKNGELKIRMTTTKVMQGGTVNVRVFYETLNEVQASQGAVVFSDKTLEGKRLTLVSNEGSQIKLTVDASMLTSKVNSAGEIQVQGSANAIDVVANTGGKFLGSKLETETADVAANAGGIAEVNVSASVKATARAGGVIDVYGDPDDRSAKNVIGGTINFK